MQNSSWSHFSISMFPPQCYLILIFINVKNSFVQIYCRKSIFTCMGVEDLFYSSVRITQKIQILASVTKTEAASERGVSELNTVLDILEDLPTVKTITVMTSVMASKWLLRV
jgi:hypothetical protein